jgi:hypothetical protein
VSAKAEGFHLLKDELSPSAVRAIFKWRDHPELGRLLSKLLSHTSRKPFLDSYAEALVALHLLRHRCELRFEIPTPNGKRCDFEVRFGSQKFFLHVKRLDSAGEHATHRTSIKTTHLRPLERIDRPYIVQVRWHHDPTLSQTRLFLDQADDFIRHARIGDEMMARDEDGAQIGGLRILAPWEGDHVHIAVVPGAASGGFVDLMPRFFKLLQRAYQQFMPRAVNVVLMCSDQAHDVTEFEHALLGAHIERWDAYPPRGKRIAHGRAEDGFWQGRRFTESQVAGWFHFTPTKRAIAPRLWLRDTRDSVPAVQTLVGRVFGAKSTSGSGQ